MSVLCTRNSSDISSAVLLLNTEEVQDKQLRIYNNNSKPNISIFVNWKLNAASMYKQNYVKWATLSLITCLIQGMKYQQFKGFELLKLYRYVHFKGG